MMLAAEELPDGRIQGFAQNVPAGLFDGAHADGLAEIARLVHLVPEAFRMQRVLADDVAAQLLQVADGGFGGKPAGGFTKADNAFVGV